MRPARYRATTPERSSQQPLERRAGRALFAATTIELFDARNPITAGDAILKDALEEGGE